MISVYETDILYTGIEGGHLITQNMKTQTLFVTFPDEPKAILKEMRNFLAGRAVGITRDEALLEEILKVLFCLYDAEKVSTGSAVDKAKLIRNRFSQIKGVYPEFYEVTEEILLDPQSLEYVIAGLQKLLKYRATTDIVGDCYEVFIGNSVRGQEGQFFTPKVAVDSLIKMVDPKPDWTVIDTACGASGFLSALYLYLAAKYPEDQVREFAKKNLFGIEKDRYLARLGRIHMTLLTGEKVSIACGDSLSMEGDTGLDKIKNVVFDLIITNPPFGAKIKSASKETLKKYSLGYKWTEYQGKYIKSGQLSDNVPPQTLFMERNIVGLKVGGILATVMPESLVSNKNYKHVVQYVLDNCTILAVLGMPESLFKTSGKGGTHTKTCLLVAKRELKSQDEKIFFAEAKWCGHDSRANTIEKNDLPKILENYFKYKTTGTVKGSSLGYVIRRDDVKDHVLAPKYYDIELEGIKANLTAKNKLVTIRELVDTGWLKISTGDEVGKVAYGTGSIPYIRTSDISNWEIKTDAKQYISEDVYERLRRKQDIRAGDLLMVKDGTYLIGTVAYVTSVDTKMVYQSHLYKMRIIDNDFGLNSYCLLAILSSSFVQRQIKSKQLTQDIIDSLGKRIYDLVLPIPSDKGVLIRLSNEVRDIILLKEKSKKSTAKVTELVSLLFA